MPAMKHDAPIAPSSILGANGNPCPATCLSAPCGKPPHVAIGPAGRRAADRLPTLRLNGLAVVVWLVVSLVDTVAVQAQAESAASATQQEQAPQAANENQANSQNQEPRPLGRMELEKLQWLLGQWSTAADAPITAKATGQWSTDGQFLLLDYEVTAPGFPAIRSSERIAWDPAAKTYRSWTFRGDGGFGQANWVSRDSGWMIRYGGTHGDGRQFSSTLLLAQGDNGELKLSAIERWVGDEQFPDLVLELQQQDLAITPAGALEGQVWALTRLRNGAVRGQNRPTIFLQENEVQAFGGINQIGGGYVRDGQQLRFRNLVSTLMGGAAAESELEQEFSATLEKITQFSFEGKTLVLSGSAGPLAWFEAQSPAPAVVDFEQVLNVTWELSELNGQAVDSDTPLTLSFTDGSVTGFGGVNQMGGTYNVTDQALSFGPLRATRRGGPPAAMEREGRFAQTLARVDRFDLQDGQLLLLSGTEIVAKFRRQP
jgi:heat shock protein HslJ